MDSARDWRLPTKRTRRTQDDWAAQRQADNFSGTLRRSVHLWSQARADKQRGRSGHYRKNHSASRPWITDWEGATTRMKVKDFKGSQLPSEEWSGEHGSVVRRRGTKSLERLAQNPVTPHWKRHRPRLLLDDHGEGQSLHKGRKSKLRPAVRKIGWPRSARSGRFSGGFSGHRVIGAQLATNRPPPPHPPPPPPLPPHSSPFISPALLHPTGHGLGFEQHALSGHDENAALRTQLFVLQLHGQVSQSTSTRGVDHGVLWQHPPLGARHDMSPRWSHLRLHG